MEGKTKRERPRRVWLYNVKEWCNEEIYILKWKALDRDARKKFFLMCIGREWVMNPWHIGWMYSNDRIFTISVPAFNIVLLSIWPFIKCFSQEDPFRRVIVMPTRITPDVD